MTVDHIMMRPASCIRYTRSLGYLASRVEDRKEDIDTLLVFAGLFSTVITTFIVELYQNLQRQPQDATNQILLQISSQLASLSINGNFINSTVSSFTLPPFKTSQFSVRINTL
ncbi:hypothetical protein QCA50_007042 [Cerrena zonata]|uniref:DUF6535 domain-containing protein n=1 Tax=Cerrena zonata TaxID=2478898 RepID=A0AAW0GL77_9APHY